MSCSVCLGHSWGFKFLTGTEPPREVSEVSHGDCESLVIVAAGVFVWVGLYTWLSIQLSHPVDTFDWSANQLNPVSRLIINSWLLLAFRGYTLKANYCSQFKPWMKELQKRADRIHNVNFVVGKTNRVCESCTSTARAMCSMRPTRCCACPLSWMGRTCACVAIIKIYGVMLRTVQSDWKRLLKVGYMHWNSIWIRRVTVRTVNCS